MLQITGNAAEHDKPENHESLCSFNLSGTNELEVLLCIAYPKHPILQLGAKRVAYSNGSKGRQQRRCFDVLQWLHDLRRWWF